MIVRCISKSGDELPKELFSLKGWNQEMDFPWISIGVGYTVYAISYNLGHPFYMVCGDDYDGKYVNYPQLLPGCLFEIIDDSYSSYWVEKEIKNDKSRYENTKVIGFKEFVENKYFYGNLLEGNKKEVKQFAQAKDLIDKESIT